MRENTLKIHRHWLLLAASGLLTSCGIFGDDEERYEKLDRLRVLAMRAEPADLSLGETTRLSANVYEPAGRELSYDWSWCPSRADSTRGFECNVSEQDLQRAWTAAGLDGSAPSYHLGTTPEVELTHQLGPALVTALCQSPDLDERIVAACFAGLEASIKLIVRSSEAELTAIKSVTLLAGETAELERNANPPSDFELTLRDRASGGTVENDQPLQAGHRYALLARVDDAVAESFTPRVREGEPNPGRRRETLVMSWFVTVGELVGPKDDDEGFGDDFSRTTFVDGSNRVEDLAENGWELPQNAGSSAELHLVLRDERGGTGWTARRFDVVGGQP
jgi:hypothetical protein